jgi:hypothetical protein
MYKIFTFCASPPLTVYSDIHAKKTAIYGKYVNFGSFINRLKVRGEDIVGFYG